MIESNSYNATVLVNEVEIGYRFRFYKNIDEFIQPLKKMCEELVSDGSVSKFQETAPLIAEEWTKGKGDQYLYGYFTEQLPDLTSNAISNIKQVVVSGRYDELLKILPSYSEYQKASKTAQGWTQLKMKETISATSSALQALKSETAASSVINFDEFTFAKFNFDTWSKFDGLLGLADIGVIEDSNVFSGDQEFSSFIKPFFISGSYDRDATKQFLNDNGVDPNQGSQSSFAKIKSDSKLYDKIKVALNSVAQAIVERPYELSSEENDRKSAEVYNNLLRFNKGDKASKPYFLKLKNAQFTIPVGASDIFFKELNVLK